MQNIIAYEKQNRDKNRIKQITKAIVMSNLSLLLLFIFCTTILISVFFGTRANHSEGLINGSLNGVPQEFIPYFNEASEVIGIPNWVLAAVAKQESNFTINCSYGGAYGIMQMQKIDYASKEDLWAYYMNTGLDQIYKDLGYEFSTTDDMWNIFLNDARVQIFAGAYELRCYTNYVLFKQHKTDKLVYNSKENLSLINWSADENDSDLKETLRRIFACYNGGQGYGMKVDLDNAKFNYPNKVYKYAIEYRGNGLDFGNGAYIGDNETIEKAIAVGSELVGKSPYTWGAGRNPLDIHKKLFDCSSFVHYCFAQAGIVLGDYRVVVTDSLAKEGRKVMFDEIKRGDIIFFDTYKKNGHVGIYLGGDKFLHDSTSKGVSIASLNNSYWKKVFKGHVRRIVEIN